MTDQFESGYRPDPGQYILTDESFSGGNADGVTVSAPAGENVSPSGVPGESPEKKGSAKKIFKALGISAAFLAGYYLIQIILFAVYSVIISVYLSMLMAMGSVAQEDFADKVTELYYKNAVYVFILCGLISIALIVLIMRVLWKKGKWDMFKILRLPDKNRFNAGTAVMCVFLGMTFNAGTSFLIDALPVPEKWLEANEESTSAIMSGGLLPALFAAAVIAPLVEELLFRGIFYHSLKESLPLKNSTAAVITTAVVSICFGIYHGNILQGIYTALFAVVLSVILEKTGTLWAPVLGHLGFNSAWLPLALTSFLPESTPSWLLAVVFFAVFAVLFTVFLVGGKRKQYAGRGNDTGAGQTCY